MGGVFLTVTHKYLMGNTDIHVYLPVHMCKEQHVGVVPLFLPYGPLGSNSDYQTWQYALYTQIFGQC